MATAEEVVNNGRSNTQENNTNGDLHRTESVKKSNSFRKSAQNFNDSISSLAQHELLVLFNNTKKSLATAAKRGREKIRKYEKEFVRRTQSAPYKIVEKNVVNGEGKQNGVNGNGGLFYERREFEPRASVPEVYYKPTEDTDLWLKQNFVNQNVAEPSLRQRKDLPPRRFFNSNVPLRKSILKPEKPVSCKNRQQEEYPKLKRLLRKCLCELFLIMILCGLGGLVFKFTEGSFETYYKCGVKRVKRDFIDLLWTKSHNLREDDWKSLARMKLRIFEEELHNAHEAGMTEYSGQRSWSFLNGIVYCLTIVTTIGYGHMFPKTNTGRALTIVYALIGIPLFLIALTDFGKLFTRGIKFLWSYVRRLYYTGSCRSMRKNSGVDDMFKGAQMVYDYATSFGGEAKDQAQSDVSQPQTTSPPNTPAISNFEIDDEFNLPISVALFILVAYIFCGAVMYMVIEKWGFFEAFYFVFISMSTIGFGDYVPRDPVFMIGSIIYLVFGLALMSMCINVVQAKLSDTFKQASAKIGATIGLEVDENGSIKTCSPEEEKPEITVTEINEKQ